MISPRKHKISRLEEFSDAVFGFALTLLVITTNAPRSYADLMMLLQGIPAFACCFALLVWTRMTLDQLALVSTIYGLGFFVLMSLFALVGPGHWWHGIRTTRRREAFAARLGGAVAEVS